MMVSSPVHDRLSKLEERLDMLHRAPENYLLFQRMSKNLLADAEQKTSTLTNLPEDSDHHETGEKRLSHARVSEKLQHPTEEAKMLTQALETENLQQLKKGPAKKNNPNRESLTRESKIGQGRDSKAGQGRDSKTGQGRDSKTGQGRGSSPGQGRDSAAETRASEVADFKPRPLGDMWQIMKMTSNIDNNTMGIDKVSRLGNSMRISLCHTTDLFIENYHNC